MAGLSINITGLDSFEKLIRLIKEVADETTEPHIREKILTGVREIAAEAANGH